MSLQGLSKLVASIMAAGDVAALDARDPRLAHQALVELEQIGTAVSHAVLVRFDVTVRTQPDPDVGLRVAGLTLATWEAVANGLLEAHERGPDAWFELSSPDRDRLREAILQLPIGEAECLYRVGAAWAASSTAWKNLAAADASACKRVLNFA